MKDTLEAGLATTRRFEIDAPRTIDFLAAGEGGGPRVYATPALVADIETTCRDLLLEHLDEGEDSLGTRVRIDHLAPTLIGMWAEISVELNALDGRAASFTVAVRDPIDDSVAKGTHSRFIIDVARTAERLRHKAEAFGAAS